MRGHSLCVLIVAGLPFSGAGAVAETKIPEVAGSVAFLESVFVERQYEYLPISPPSEEVYIHRENSVIPVDWTGFPSCFKQLMVAEMERGWFPVYKVLIYEDPATRQTVFLNVSGTEVCRLEPQTGYDAYAWQKAAFGITDVSAVDAWTRWIFDPAHIAVELSLVPEMFYTDYISGSEAFTSGAEAPAVMTASAPALPGEIDPGTNSTESVTGVPAIITFDVPSGFGTNSAEIFQCSNLVAAAWEVGVESIAVTGGTDLVWTDSTSSNIPLRYYILNDPSLDDDDDGLNDGAERYLAALGTDWTDPDSDDDGLGDGWEVERSLDPLSSSNEWVISGFPGLAVTEPTNGYPASFETFSPPVSNGWNPAGLIAEWTRTAGAGESVVMTSAEEIEALAVCSATTNAVAATWFTNGYGYAQMPADGFKMIWPLTATATGAPIRVNNTEAWWVAPGHVSTGETFSIFGRNLGAECQAYIEGYGWVTNSSCNPYRAEFTVPGLANGTHTVYAHNSQGGKYGWSRPVELNVDGGFQWDNDTNSWINVKDYGATGDGVSDDLQEISFALGDCPNGGTVYFPAGTYAVGARITASLSSKRLLGDGPNSSVITAHASFSEGGSNGILHTKPKNAEIRDMGFSQGAGKVSKVLRMRSMYRVRFVNCRFDNLNGNPADYTNTVDVENGEHLTFENCTFITYAGESFPYNTGLILRDCDFRGWGDDASGYMLAVNANKQLLIENCTGTHYDASDYTDGWGWCQGRFILLDGNYGANRNTYIGGCATTNMGVRYNFDESRWYTGHAHYNAGEQILAEHQRTLERMAVSTATSNTFTCPDIVMPDYLSSTIKVLDGPLSNQTRTVTSVERDSWRLYIDTDWLAVGDDTYPKGGNLILIDGTETQEVASAGTDYVSLRHSLPGLMATVVAGTGSGQSRYITGADRETNGVVTVSESWNVIPDSNSVISAGRYLSRAAVVGNHLDGWAYEAKPYDSANDEPPYSTNSSPVDTASCGVSFYGGASECVVYSNLITDVKSGVIMWAYVDDSTPTSRLSIAQPNYFNAVYGNTVSNARNGVELSSYHPQGPPYQPDAASMGHSIRGNSLDEIYEPAFGISMVTNLLTTDATVWEFNAMSSLHSNVWGSYEGINTFTNRNTVN